jgi:Aspartyl protease
MNYQTLQYSRLRAVHHNSAMSFLGWLLLTLIAYDINFQLLVVYSLQPSIKLCLLCSHKNTYVYLSGSRKQWASVLWSSKQAESDISSMKIQDIKAELKRRNVSIQNVFEKEELIRRLAIARQASNRELSNNDDGNTACIRTPLYFTTMDEGVRVAAENMDGGIIVQPSTQPYATMKIQVLNPAKGDSFTLSLLMDTACSSFVLKPGICAKYNLPSYSTPVTMQGAAGVTQTTGLTQIQQFTVPNINPQGASRPFGPLPAAVQEIGGLPSAIDGIIGLTFFNQFAAMELDFLEGMVLFYKDQDAIPGHSEKVVVADTAMQLVGSLGIYTVPVYFGGRGPVIMLVDTGASCTLLNWKGVADLGLDRATSPQIARIPIPTGAMGSENVAISLTHRLHVSSTLQLGDRSSKGIQLESRLAIDIGDIPIFDALPTVGGVLGMDALTKCDVLRISTRNPARIIMFQ